MRVITVMISIRAINDIHKSYNHSNNYDKNKTIIIYRNHQKDRTVGNHEIWYK